MFNNYLYIFIISYYISSHAFSFQKKSENCSATISRRLFCNIFVEKKMKLFKGLNEKLKHKTCPFYCIQYAQYIRLNK